MSISKLKSKTENKTKNKTKTKAKFNAKYNVHAFSGYDDAVSIKTILQSSPLIERLETEILLMKVLSQSRAYLHTYPDKILSSEKVIQINKLIERRITGEPIAYIVGEKEFWSELFYVNKFTLIPRPETELLVELVLNDFDTENKWHFLELGTGTGAVGISLAKAFKNAKFILTDISKNTLKITKKNIERYACQNITLRESDWFSVLPQTEKFHAIISNPPYLAEEDSHLKKGDLRFEPYAALVGGKTGLEALEIILSHAKNYLLPNGKVYLEHGYNQGPQVKDLFEKYGFSSIHLHKDFANLPRVTSGILFGSI